MFAKNMRPILVPFIFLFILSGMLKAQPLGLHPENPNYFIYQGKPAILITSGEHYGAVLNKEFNCQLYLETLQKEGFNYTRIFIGPYSEMNSDQFGITRNTMNPKADNWLTPWAKDPETGKYDLTTWNNEFFSRLKTFIQMASEKGIIVEVTLHTSYYIDKHWLQSPYYFRNNINNLDSIHYNRANTLFNGKLKEFDEMYIRKTVTELNDYDNIFFEIQNEPWSDNPNLAAVRTARVYSEWQRLVEIANNISLDWQKRIAAVITETESQLPKKHLIAQNMCNYGTKIEGDFENISIFNFHYADPLAAYENINRKAVMALDETGFMPHDDFNYRRQAWKFMLAGGGLYNNLDYSFVIGGENGTWPIDERTPGWGGPSIRFQFRVLKDFMERLDFINMKPDPDLVKFGGIEIQTLVNSGKQYALYVDDQSIKRLIIQVEPGTYDCEVIDPLTGKKTKSENINAFNGIAEISLSFKEDAAILINRTGNSPDKSNSGVQEGKITWIQSSADMPWYKSQISFSDGKEANHDAIITEDQLQVVDGFGVCFNELGWTALSGLDKETRQNIIKDLFDVNTGLRLNICRMPIGANDYALDYYSLNDSVGDFEMKYFNIERDKKNLIPFIKAAQKYRSDLQIWGSPWTPPAWMKTNNHYACRPDVVNDMTTDQAGQEGITQFRMKTEYLSAYAKYFVKYIEAYHEEGIKITAIHPQNEMNSCQNFPSCIWTATSLGHFIGRYLGPALKQSHPDVRLWYGTYERPWVEKIDTILTDQETAQYISGISFQWAGKQAIPGVHSKYPKLKLMQSETECGDGSNDWKAAEYTYSLMNHYFNNGVSVYSFWNSVLDETGKSMWGWKQNSMITIDSKTNEVTYNPEFYLLKHFSAFIDPGAYRLRISGNDNDLLAFRNPDGSTVIVSGNTSDELKNVRVKIGNEVLNASLNPRTFNTFIIPSSETGETYCTEEDYLTMTKYDVHCHIETDRPVLMQTAAANNFKILTINVEAGSDIDEQLKYALVQKKMFPDRLGFLTTFSMKDYEQEGWSKETVNRIKKSIKKGALGVKVWKNIGMVEKNNQGNFIMIDDAGFDPVFKFLDENHIPVLGHLGEPKNCWLPLEEMTVNNDRSYFEEHPQYHMYLHPALPTYEDQINARDNRLRKNPGLIFTGAHMASLEWSVDELAKRLEEFPQMTVDLAARICHLQYQAQIDWQKVRNFMITYQDRIMYGTDSGDEGTGDADNMEKRISYGWKQDWKFFTSGEIMNSPDVNGEFRGLKLPASVVEKIYFTNADRVFGKAFGNSLAK